MGNTACNSTIGPLHAVDMVYKNRFSKHVHITDLREITKNRFLSFSKHVHISQIWGKLLESLAVNSIWKWFWGEFGVAQLTNDCKLNLNVLYFAFSVFFFFFQTGCLLWAPLHLCSRPCQQVVCNEKMFLIMTFPDMHPFGISQSLQQEVCIVGPNVSFLQQLIWPF